MGPTHMQQQAAPSRAMSSQAHTASWVEPAPAQQTEGGVGSAWESVARSGHRFESIPVSSGFRGAAPSSRATSAMPIQAKWEDSDFKPGDKVFGTSSVYNAAAEEIKKAVPTDKQFAMTMGSMISNVKNPDDVENQPMDDEPNLKEWQSFIAHYPEWQQQKASRQGSSTFQKVSKAAVDFTTQKQGNKIHFVKGDLDWSHAADKRTSQGKRTTAHELRYIFRNWDKMKDQVRFYSDKKGTPALPPWEAEDTKAAWEDYAQRRKSK